MNQLFNDFVREKTLVLIKLDLPSSRPLLFAIPKYNSNDDMHLKLADIGKECHEKVKAMKFAQKNNVRAEVRNKLKGEITKVNKIVSKIINIRMEGE